MRFDRIEAMADDFGADTIFLIGGDLLVRPEGIEAGTRAFVERVRARFP
jgi:ribulose 1,5-bisphosphate carboxylase large subunit-like protein